MTTLTRENKLTAPTRNSHVAWTATNPVVPEGVLIIVKDRLYVGSVEYAIGDGVSNYNALRKFGEAKDVDGKIDLANVMTNSANGLLKLDANGKAPAERLYITGALADGAIIESGENANGRYIKFADGTMICYILNKINTNPSSAYLAINFNLPHEFIDTNYIVVCTPTDVPSKPVVWIARYAYPTPNSMYFIYLYTLDGSTFGGTYPVNFNTLAIGRWK